MLPQTHRLRSNDDFRRVYREGRVSSSPLFRMHILFHNEGKTRVGIVLSNKIIKKAVARNRKKRQLRAILRTLAPMMKSGYDVVVTCLPSAASTSFDELNKDLQRELRTLQLIEHE